MQSEKRRNRTKTNVTTLSELVNVIETIPTALPTENVESNCRIEVLLIEPFYGGSHKQLIDVLAKNIPHSKLITLSPKKWHWRARCASLVLSEAIPELVGTEHFLFCSSVLSLAELIGLRPDLAALKKIVFFHENQTVYPIREIKERDVQFAYNQITTCLAADSVIFNSSYNRDSFLDNLSRIVKLLPDYRPKHLRYKIEPKCSVLYFPVEFPVLLGDNLRLSQDVLHIVWPHRWEFDKDPDLFIDTLVKLKSEGLNFRVSILGETFTEVPELLIRARELLNREIVHYGFLESKNEYFRVLQDSHIAVSTARHEFYGVSMLEAAYCGCFPLVPNRLVYPEIYPVECLYSTGDDLYTKLKEFCLNPVLTVNARANLELDLCKFSMECLLSKYKQLFS